MEEPNSLQDWELLSDSDSNSQIAFEEIIHADSFSLDSTNLPSNNQGLVLSTIEQLCLDDVGESEKNSLSFGAKPGNFDSDYALGFGEVNKGGSSLEDGSKMEVGLEGSEMKNQNSFVIDDEHELGVGEINKGGCFIVDDSKLEVRIEENEIKYQNSYVIDSKHELGVREINKGGFFIVDDSKMEVRIEGNEIKYQNSYVIDSKHELGVGEINKGASLIVDESRMEVGIEGSANGDSFRGDNAKIDVGFKATESESKNSYAIGCNRDLGVQNIHEGNSLLVDDLKGDVSIEEIDTSNQSSQELGSDSPMEMQNAGSISVNNGEKKVFIWWRLPLDMIKLFASKVRPVWSISIAAAVIGMLMVGRKLYQMKNKSRRIPLKISFEDKKVASQLLIRAARLNEAIVRRVPVVRSPLLPTGGITPWSMVGQV